MGIDSIGSGGIKPPGGAGSGVGAAGSGVGASGGVGRGGAASEDFRAVQAELGATSDAASPTEAAQGAPVTGAPVTGAARDAAPSDLDRLAAREINFDEYVELRLERALGHLQDQLGPEQISAVREQLRDQLATDPTLIRLLSQIQREASDGTRGA